MSDRTPFGSRPIHKIFDGDDAPSWYHFAFKKLEHMRMSQSGPVQQFITPTSDVSIHIQKNVSWDRISIKTGGFTWVGIASGSSFAGIEYIVTQVARSPISGGPWVETPKGLYTPVPDYATQDIPWDAFNTLLQVNQMPITSLPIMNLGDGRTSFSFYAGKNRSQYVFKPNGKFDTIVYITSGQLFGSQGPTIVLPPPLFAGAGYYGIEGLNTVAYDIQPIWAKNPALQDRVTLQFSVWGTHPVTYTVGGIDFLVYQFRFNRIDVDNGGVENLAYFDPGLPNIIPYGPMVDVTLNKGPGYGFGFQYPPYCYLTPETIVATRFYDASAAAIPTEFFDASSIDGGRTWTYFSRGFGEGVSYDFGALDILKTRSYMVALNSQYALRLQNKVQAPNLRYVVEKVGVDGTVRELYTLPHDNDPTIGAVAPADPASVTFANVAIPQLYALGRGCYAIRIFYPYVIVAADPGNPFSAPAIPATVGVFTYRCKTIRSYDSGVTWDSPVDEGFDITGESGSGYILLDRNGNVDQERFVHSPWCYPRRPYVPGGDGGEVYQVITRYLPYTRSDLQPLPLTECGSTLYRSTDQMKTWQPLALMSGKHASLTYSQAHNSGEVRFRYLNIVDKNAPIDPIFPWRVDARVSPPDWW